MTNQAIQDLSMNSQTMIVGTLSPEMFLIAQRLHRKSFTKKQCWVLLTLIALGLLIIAAGYQLIGLVIAGGGVGGLVGELVFSRFTLPRKVLKTYQQQASLKSTFHYSWDAEHLSVESDLGHAKQPWTNYIKRKENEHVFLLYHSDNMFEMLPKSWFVDENQIVAFRQSASRNQTEGT